MRKPFAALLAVMLALAPPASAIAATPAHAAAKSTTAKHGKAGAAKHGKAGHASKTTPRAATTPAVTTTPATTTPQSQLTPPSASNPLAPGLPETAASTPTSTSAATLPRVVTSSTTPTNSGLSGSGIAFIAAGAVLLIAAIGFFVWRDSRKHAHRRHVTTAKKPQPKPKVPGSQRPPKARKLSPSERRRRKRGRAR